jgi:hypothetical protein
MCHTTYGRLTGLGLETLLVIQAALRGEVMLKSDPAALRISGPSTAVMSSRPLSAPRP